MRERIEVEIAAAEDGKGAEHTLAIADGLRFVKIDQLEKYGNITRNPFFESLDLKESRRDFSAKPTQTFAKMGGKRTRTELVAGQVCEVWEIPSMSSEYCMWNGLILQSKVGAGSNQIVRRAVKIAEGIDVPAEKFAVPRDVTLEKGDGNGARGAGIVR